MEQEPLADVNEVSVTEETAHELQARKEPFKSKESATPADIEMERLTEKLQESQEEILSLTKERDNLKVIKEALQLECDQLKEAMQETLAKVNFLPLLGILFFKNRVFIEGHLFYYQSVVTTFKYQS